MLNERGHGRVSSLLRDKVSSNIKEGPLGSLDLHLKRGPFRATGLQLCELHTCAHASPEYISGSQSAVSEGLRTNSGSGGAPAADTGVPLAKDMCHCRGRQSLHLPTLMCTSPSPASLTQMPQTPSSLSLEWCGSPRASQRPVADSSPGASALCTYSARESERLASLS